MAEQKFAINPYNFIPFGLAPERMPLDEHFSGPLESGWIDVRLTVKTPLIIPDGANHKNVPIQYRNKKGNVVKAERKEFSFFCLPDGTPAIPGSSLRGMLRSVFEAASNSCLPFLERKPITQRTLTYAAYKERGVLVFEPGTGECRLYRAERWSCRTTREALAATGRFLGLDNGAHVWFRGHAGELEKRSLKLVSAPGEPDDRQEGVLQFNIPAVSQDYNVAVLVPAGRPLLTWKPDDDEPESEEQSSPYQLLRAAIYDTLENIDSDQEKRVARGMELPNAAKPMRALLDALDAAHASGGMVPCYFKEILRGKEKLYYFSPAAIGRVRQRRSWSEIMAAYSPCTDLDGRETPVSAYNHHAGVCQACALFGTADTFHAADPDARGAKGRLRFTDAVPDRNVHPDGRVDLQTYDLPILGGPKPTAFEFYMRKPADDAHFWNFDYYGRKTGRDSADYCDIPEATPRGRKMYWHSEPRTVNPFALERPDLSAAMQAAERDSVFLFRIYFDRITAGQREKLLWLIALGDNRTDSPMQFKLGHAKPAGFGSVKLTVDRCVRRALPASPGAPVVLEELPAAPERSGFRESSLAFRSLMRMCDSRTAAGHTVDYPTGRRRDKEPWSVYGWFGRNRVRQDGTLVLPEPTESAGKLALPTERMDAVTDFPQQVLTQPALKKKLREEQAEAEKEREKADTSSAFDRAAAHYPVGRVIEAAVQKVVIRRNRGLLFFKLPDVPYQVMAEYVPGKKSKYWEGKEVRLRITGTGENSEGYPNFLAEIVK